MAPEDALADANLKLPEVAEDASHIVAVIYPKVGTEPAICMCSGSWPSVVTLRGTPGGVTREPPA